MNANADSVVQLFRPAVARTVAPPARALIPAPTPYLQLPPATATTYPQIVGERAYRTHFLDAWLVDYLTVDGNYVSAHLGEESYLARATMKYMACELAAFGFVRIARSVLVNLRRVAHVERSERGQYAFVMRCGTRLVSSRERYPALRRLLVVPLRMPSTSADIDP